MASLMEDFEQQYAILSAEITTKISAVSTGGDADKAAVLRSTERLLEEANELLEQMELEVQSMPGDLKLKYSNRVKSYQVELKRLKKEYVDTKNMTKIEIYSSRGGLGDDVGFSYDDKELLLDTTERMERSNKTLRSGKKVAVETEQIGAQILADLSSQRDTISRARQRLRDTDNDVGRSSQLLTGMLRKALQNRVELFFPPVKLWPLIGDLSILDFVNSYHEEIKRSLTQALSDF